MRRLCSILLIAAALAFSSDVQAAIVTFHDAGDFFSAVGPTKSADWPTATTTDHAAAWVTRNGTRFAYGENNNDFTNTLKRDDFTPILPGYEISVRGQDNLRILLGKVITQPIGEIFAPDESLFAFGLSIAELTDSATGQDSGALFQDSTFRFDVFDKNIDLIGSVVFNPANDTSAFIGVWSDTAIRQVDITELTQDAGDEFYGNFYAGFTQLAPIPEPSTLAIWSILGGIGLVVGRTRRKRSFVPSE